MKIFIRVNQILLAILLAGFSLASQAFWREPPIEVEVSVQHNLPAEKLTFSIVPFSYQSRNSHGYDQLSRALASELIKKGYTQTPLATEADILVFFDYNISEVIEYTYDPPIFVRRVEVTMLDRAAFEKRNVVRHYHAEAISRSLDSNLVFATPYHFRAMFADFPTLKRYQKTYIVRGLNDGQVVEEPMQPGDPNYDFLNANFPFTN